MLLHSSFPRATRYWYMGSFHDWQEPVVHPMAHGLHYGTSAFEGIRAYSTASGPAVFRLREHIDRLLVSAAAARMQPPYSRDEIMEAVRQTVCENCLDCCYIRPLLFFSYGNLGLVPRTCPVELVIGAWDMGQYLGEKCDIGVRVRITARRRVHPTQFDMSAKLGGVYVQSMTCALDARQAGYDEAVFLNLEGRVAEGPGENIFIVKDRVLTTNDRRESVLEGITRTSLLELAGDLGYRTVIGPITREAFFSADEAFFCGTAVEIVPIVSVTDASSGEEAGTHVIGAGIPGPVTAAMVAAFRAAVTGRSAAYVKWLSPVGAPGASRTGYPRNPACA